MPDADPFGTPPGPDDQATSPIDDAGTTGVTDEAADAADAADAAPAPLPIDADEVLLAAVDVARTALLDITPADTIGAPVGHIVEGEHVLSLLFECTMAGYPGWRWTVSMSRIDENSEPFVLETELMPGETALLAPEWVPWSERLADYRSAQDAAAALALADAISSDDDDVDDLEDEDDEDEDEDEDEDDDDDDDEDEDEDEDEDDDDGDEDDELEEADLVDDEFADDLTELIDEDIESFDGDDESDERLNESEAESGQESTSPEVDPGEASDAEGDSDESAPEPPAVAGGDQGVVEDDKDNERH
jgi:Protein of unknown function (DUF3027)